MGVKELFKPNVFKILFSVFIFIIIFSIIWLNNRYDYFWNKPPIFSFVFIVIISAIIAYLLGSLLDHFIKNKWIKIIIAVILALTSIVIGWTALTSRIIVCDPVHVPGDGNTTPVVCDPVHTPN